MMKSPPSWQTLETSKRLYRSMLLLYPKSFRQVYGQEMIQTFGDCCHAALSRGGTKSLIELWGFTFYDLMMTALAEHLRNGLVMFKRLFGLGKEYTMLDHLLHLDVALRTDIGRIRANNEDSMISVVPQDPQIMTKRGALFVVADGMGGHEKGEVASEITTKAVSTAYYQDESDDIAAALSRAVKHANASVCQRIEQDGEVDNPMGSTCIAAVLQGDSVHVANVGDSRVYIVRQGQVKQVSQDHSWVNEQVRSGALTLEQARAMGKNNLITRCLGTRAEVDVDLFTEQVQAGDVLVLCTDGLTNLVSDDEIGTIVEQYDSQESTHRLIECANERGGPDNITAIVVRVGSAAA